MLFICKGDYLSISNEFSIINWIHEFNSQDISTMLEFFYFKYIEFTDKYISSVNFLPRDPSHPLWLDTTTLKLIRKKNKAWAKYKVTKQQSDFLAFVKIRNFTTSAIKNAKFVYEHIKIIPKIFGICSLFH